MMIIYSMINTIIYLHFIKLNFLLFHFLHCVTIMVRKGSTISSQARMFILNLREYFEEERRQYKMNPFGIPLNNVVKRTADALKISRTTVVNVYKEMAVLKASNSNSMDQENQENIDPVGQGSSTVLTPVPTQMQVPKSKPLILASPGKRRPRRSQVTHVDDFTRDAIRRHIYDYYRDKKFPTRAKLQQSLREAELFNGSTSSLSNVLQKCGFQWKKFNSRCILMERVDIRVSGLFFFFGQFNFINFKILFHLGKTV